MAFVDTTQDWDVSIDKVYKALLNKVDTEIEGIMKESSDTK